MATIADDVKRNINQMYDRQKQSQLGQLRQSRDKAIGNINNQKQETSANYYDKRNQADVVNFQNKKRLRELMASSGLGRSGENISGQVGLQAARQQALGGLNREEQGILNQFNQQITDLRDPSREQSIIDAIESQRSQALAAALERARQEAFQREQFEWQKKMEQARLDLARLRASRGPGSGNDDDDNEPIKNVNTAEEIYRDAMHEKDIKDRQVHKGVLRPFLGTTPYYNKMGRVMKGLYNPNEL